MNKSWHYLGDWIVLNDADAQRNRSNQGEKGAGETEMLRRKIAISMQQTIAEARNTESEREEQCCKMEEYETVTIYISLGIKHCLNKLFQVFWLLMWMVCCCSAFHLEAITSRSISQMFLAWIRSSSRWDPSDHQRKMININQCGLCVILSHLLLSH